MKRKNNFHNDSSVLFIDKNTVGVNDFPPTGSYFRNEIPFDKCMFILEQISASLQEYGQDE